MNIRPLAVATDPPILGTPIGIGRKDGNATVPLSREVPKRRVQTRLPDLSSHAPTQTKGNGWNGSASGRRKRAMFEALGQSARENWPQHLPHKLCDIRLRHTT